MNLNFTTIMLGALILLAAVGGVAMAVLPNAPAGDIVVEVAPTIAPTPTAVPEEPADTHVGVYISGSVVSPGVYIVDGGSRLANVVLLAGGATADADMSAVNLAAVVQDEDHWHIPDKADGVSAAGGLSAASRAGSGSASASAGAGGGKVDLNGADVDLLKTLPGIGDVRAQAIVSHREANGRFGSVDGLLDVDGIGAGTVENIRHLVTVE